MSQSGYWPASPWPVECGGNHRPMVTDVPGFNLQPTDHLVATTRNTGRWNVSFVQRDPGELYLYGTTLPREPDVAGWVERVDPKTLEPLASSGKLPAGGHEWPGGVAAHRNGDVYVVSGAYLHRLAPDCSIIAALPLPVDYAHDGLLILDDGSIITKDIRVGDGAEPSTLTVCDEDLGVVCTVRLPEPSMGRLSAVGDYIYVAGSTKVFRYRWDGGALLFDETWQPEYRRVGQGGMSWGTTIVNGRVWLMDNGNVPAIEHRFSQDPPLRVPVKEEDLLADPSWAEPIRALGISTSSPADVLTIRPTEFPSGWALAPPLVHDGILIAWDTGGTGIAAFDIGGSGAHPEMMWFQPFRTTMPPLVHPDAGELVINDYRLLDYQDSSDDLVVLDLETGQMKARIPTESKDPGFVFLSPGESGALHLCSTNTVAGVSAV